MTQFIVSLHYCLPVRAATFTSLKLIYFHDTFNSVVLTATYIMLLVRIANIQKFETSAGLNSFTI